MKSTRSEQPLVSVVIPAYNRASTVEASIESVWTQSYADWEIIVCDDCSTDKTVQVVEDLMKKENRLRLIRAQVNGGAQAARNAGIHAAKGEWIAFLDSDDQWLPDSLEVRMNIARTNNVPVVHSNAYILHPGKEKELYRVPALAGSVYKQVLSGEGPMFPCLLVKKEALERIGYLDEKIPSYQEWDTAIRLAKIYEFGFEPKPTFIYDYRTDNAISRNAVRAGRGYEIIVNKHLGEIIRHAGFEALWYHMGIAARWYQKGNDKGNYLRCKIIGTIGKCLNPFRILRLIQRMIRKTFKSK